MITTATTTRMTARETNGSSMTSFSAITMISAERMKSVRIAPVIVACSASGPDAPPGRRGRGRRAEGVHDLVGALVAEVRAADHEDDLDERRRDLAEDDRDRQDEQQLVAQRADGDPLDDRQLALGGEARARSPASRRCRPRRRPPPSRSPARRRRRRRRPTPRPASPARRRRRAARPDHQPWPEHRPLRRRRRS